MPNSVASDKYSMILSIPECNLICEYCRKDDLQEGIILTNDVLVDIAQACSEAGIKRIRWTGGEPTIRSGFVDMVRRVRDAGIERQYLSTNGTVLHKIASDLHEAGLNRVNISLDTFDSQKFYELTGKNMLDNVLESIKASVGLFEIVKINSVISKYNIKYLDKFIDFVSDFEEPPISRFIPFVDRGCGTGLSEEDTVSEEGILRALSKQYGQISPVSMKHSNNPFAQYYIIENNGLKICILSCFDSAKVIHDPNNFLTMRTNPNGHVSNCVYSPEVHTLQDLDYNDKVDLLKRLVEQKQARTPEWYEEYSKKVLINIDFWRFGGEIKDAFIRR